MSELVYCRACGKQTLRAAQTCPGLRRSSQGECARKYNGGVLTPPVHGAVKVLAALAPILGVIGFILAMATSADT